MDIQISISGQIASACPDLHILALTCEVRNTVSNEYLWKEITAFEELLCTTTKIEEVNKLLTIAATRTAYKKLGKDPNRYRPSAEALRRRIIRGLPLYKIDTLVDIINYVSLVTGYSIGGFDRNKIDGQQLVLGVGRENEIYHAIGRGLLNIAGLPVYRDTSGGIGTPTSDEERTKIDMDTTHLLMIINGYAGKAGLEEAGRMAEELLIEYVSATNVRKELFFSVNE
ncbi:MAG: hypothetical protein LUD02_04095 [Tannerellaceae bacterium]|nr:hypothetical protein [Tannerellaceae bacterium]